VIRFKKNTGSFVGDEGWGETTAQGKEEGEKSKCLIFVHRINTKLGNLKSGKKETKALGGGIRGARKGKQEALKGKKMVS